MEYGKFEDLEKNLLYKRIVKWDKDELILDDGTVITIEMSESDCCASAGGEFSNVKLDAAITNVAIEDEQSETDYYETTNTVTVNIYHNQNVIAQADCYANDGNGGYYYSVCSLVVKDVHYKVVEA